MAVAEVLTTDHPGHRADPTARRRLVGELQRHYGNRYTQQVVDRVRNGKGVLPEARATEVAEPAEAEPATRTPAAEPVSAPALPRKGPVQAPVAQPAEAEPSPAAGPPAAPAAPAKAAPPAMAREQAVPAPAVEPPTEAADESRAEADARAAGREPAAAGTTPAAAAATGPAAAKAAAAGEGPTAAPAETRGDQGPGKAPAEDAAAERAPAQPAAEGEVPAEAAAPSSPAEDPAFQAVVAKARAVTERQAHNTTALRKAQEAQEAAPPPANDLSSQAAANQVTRMDAQEPQPFDKAGFKAALLARIAEITPRNQKEADEFKKTGRAGGIKGSVTGAVQRSRQQAQGGIQQAAEEAPDPSTATPKQVTPLPPTEPGPPPPDIGAQSAAPKPRTQAEVSLDSGPRSLDQQMADADVTDEQLAESNEPEFTGALEAKGEVKAHATEAPVAYRADEAGLLAAAQASSTESALADLQSMHGARREQFRAVVDQQQGTQTRDQQARQDIGARLDAIYQATETKVNARLARLDQDVNQVFDTGAEQARRAFEDLVDRRMTAYKLKRYLLIPGGSLLWLKDRFMGLPDEVNAFYQEGRQLYISRMDAVIDRVATAVETGLNEAKSIIAAGRAEVAAYLTRLPADLQQIGQEEAGRIQGRFDQLRQSVTDKGNQLVDALAQKYVDNLKKVDDRITQMKEENQGLYDKAKDALAGVIETITRLKNMLLGVLASAAAAIGRIIKDPIGFLGNLIAGVKAGLSGFIANLGTHLQKGLMGWLFGTLAKAGITMPESFDLKGILSLAMQVLGLTYANIRARAVAILGEEMVSRLEKVAEVFIILVTQGPAGLWQYIKDKVGDLKSMVLDAIKSFVIEKIVVAGITWVLSLLNPASAFVKACKLIYDVVMFFVTRASQIMALVNAVVNTISAVAAGAIGAMASAIEAALASAIPVVISFLASLLGLGGISEKIRSIIMKIQAPINKAIDWVIHKAVKMVKAVGGFLTGKGKKKEKEEEPEEDDPEKAARIEAGLAAIDQQEAALEGEDAALTKQEAEKIAVQVRQAHPVFKKLVVVDGTTTWDYSYETSPGRKKKGSKKDIPEMALATVTPPFNINQKKYDPAEYRSQLAGQEAGINAMDVERWEKNYKAYHGDPAAGIKKRGRDPKAAKAQEDFRAAESDRLIQEKKELRDKGDADYQDKTDAQIEAEVKAFMKTQAALHDPDQVAGGEAHGITKLGSRYINSSIGSQWRTRHPSLKAAVTPFKDEDPVVRKQIKMNVKLPSQVV